MKKVLLTSFAFLFVIGLAEAGNALTLSSINGNWTSVTGGQLVTGVGTSQVRWGSPASSSGKSGFGFVGSAVPLTFGFDQIIDVGDFTHYNNPIYSGTAASSANLALALTFSDPAGLFGSYNFNFGINETPNSATPATNPANNDIVSIPNSFAAETFTIDGIEYTLQLIGFGADSSHIVSQFSTIETMENTTNIWAKVTATSPVPEPTTMLLFGAGILGLAGVARRKRS